MPIGKTLFVVFGLALLFGCATTPKEKPIPLSWPEPPETPRIKFVRTLASQADLGIKHTFMDSVVQFLTGRQQVVWHVREPMGIAVSDDGLRVYVSDYGQGLIYEFDLGKEDVRLLGAERPFGKPFGLALDAAENLYVVDQESRAIIVLDTKDNRKERVIRTISDPGIERPTDIAIDRARGLIYLVDASRQSSNNHVVKVFNLEGRFLRNIGKGKGYEDGALYFPTYIALDAAGNLYVTDTMNARVSVFDADGKFVKNIGQRGDAFGTFDKPKGVALDTFGNIYVVDSSWSNVQIFNRKGEVLLFFGGRHSYPGMMKNPTGIAITRQNTIYVADPLNFRVDVYQLVNTTALDSDMSTPDPSKGGESGETSHASKLQ